MTIESIKAIWESGNHDNKVFLIYMRDLLDEYEWDVLHALGEIPADLEEELNILEDDIMEVYDYVLG